MLGDHTDCVVGFDVDAVMDAGQAAHGIDDGAKQVGFVDIGFVLQDGGGAFQAHAGIDAGGGQRRATALGVLVELHEHEVPELDETLAIAVGMATAGVGVGAAAGFDTQQGGEFVGRREGVGLGMLAQTLFGSAVVVQLGARAGGAFQAGGSPPVIAVSVAVDALGRDADIVAPEVIGVIVVEVDGYVEAFGIQAKQAGAEFPGEGDGVLFEVVADAEIPQHFEEGEVLMVADLVDVGGAEGFLAAGKATAWRRLLAHEEGFEGNHAGRGEEQRGVAGWDQR